MKLDALNQVVTKRGLANNYGEDSEFEDSFLMSSY